MCSVQGGVAERRFCTRVVAERVGLAGSYAAGFSLQFNGVKFRRLTVGLHVSSLEKPGLYEQASVHRTELHRGVHSFQS